MEAKTSRTFITGAIHTPASPALPSLEEYRRIRQEFFAQYGAAWPGTLYDAFDILAPLVLTRAEADSIVAAAAGLGRIYECAGELVRSLSDDVLVQMGVPSGLLRTVRCAIPGLSDCVIGRFDLARTPAGYKLLEYNADVPGLLVETFSLNGLVCEHAGSLDPNYSQERLLSSVLADAVGAGLRYVGKSQTIASHVAVTCSQGSRRDRGMADYVCTLLREFSAHYAPIESLTIGERGLFDSAGNRIDVLYRIFPLQHLSAQLVRGEQTDVDLELDDAVLSLVEQRLLALINPPFAFLLESKALQVLIWNLFESGQYFGEREQRLIERYMLPTYLDAPRTGDPYVVKPAYGAEGDTVRIVGSEGRVTNAHECTTHMHEIMVYQKLVLLPAEELMTEYGRRNLHIVTSCFLLSGSPAGICMRAGEAITDESAWVLPVCLDSG